MPMGKPSSPAFKAADRPTLEATSRATHGTAHAAADRPTFEATHEAANEPTFKAALIATDGAAHEATFQQALCAAQYTTHWTAFKAAYSTPLQTAFEATIVAPLYAAFLASNKTHRATNHEAHAPSRGKRRGLHHVPDGAAKRQALYAALSAALETPQCAAERPA